MKDKGYEEAIQKQRRRVILLVLKGSTNATASEHILRQMAGNIFVPVGAERLRADLEELEELGLIRTKDVAGVMFATLRQKGSDVADGIVVVSGVDKPDLEA